jgi:hypothetical protein
VQLAPEHAEDDERRQDQDHRTGGPDARAGSADQAETHQGEEDDDGGGLADVASADDPDQGGDLVFHCTPACGSAPTIEAWIVSAGGEIIPFTATDDRGDSPAH